MALCQIKFGVLTACLLNHFRGINLANGINGAIGPLFSPAQEPLQKDFANTHHDDFYGWVTLNASVFAYIHI